MARTGLAQPQPLSRAEALELIAAWLAEQQAVGRQGERLIAVNFNERGQITSVKGASAPAKFVRLAGAKNRSA